MKRTPVQLLLLLTALVAVAACGGPGPTTGQSSPKPGDPTGPRVVVEPEAALIDAPVSIRVEGLASGDRITLRASTDTYGSLWSARAEFVAGPDGVVDVTRMAPVAGSYAGVDAMGLVWSMTPESADWRTGFARHRGLQPWAIRLAVEKGGAVIAEGKAMRLRTTNQVERHEIRRDGVVGTLFVPHGGKARPGIISLGGSEGGLREGQAALLASHGYTTMALAYFDHEDLPEHLHEIPLEYFAKAIAFMKSHPLVDGDRLGVVGISRGGELALLLGATFPEIKAVVAYAPSGVMWPGMDPARSPGATWSHEGKPLPYVPYKSDPALQASWIDKLAGGQAIEVTPMFEASMKDAAAMARAEVAVEKTNGPILLISGKADALWPSTALAEVAVKRLQKHKHGHSFEHLAYDDAGHLITAPYRPTAIDSLVHPQTKVKVAFGGTPQGNARACADSWPRVLAFFAKALGDSSPAPAAPATPPATP